LQEVKNRDDKLIMTDGKPNGTVTIASIANALHDMVIQGLNPMKKQCYFIVYGTVLACQRSYFGDEVLAKRLTPGLEFTADVIYEGEEFETQKIRSRGGLITIVTKHAIGFPRSTGKIIGAYVCAADAETGESLGDDVMDIERIKKSWEMSKTYKPGGTSPHNRFEAEMCIRTVMRHRCKPIINASNDALLLESVLRQDNDAIEAEFEDEVATLGNGEIIDVTALVTEGEPAVEAEQKESATPPPAKTGETKTAGDGEEPGY
ncbi:MAG: RecT family recombinase, partial [Fimbriimonadaceae bacterium]